MVHLIIQIIKESYFRQPQRYYLHNDIYVNRRINCTDKHFLFYNKKRQPSKDVFHKIFMRKSKYF